MVGLYKTQLRTYGSTTKLGGNYSSKENDNMVVLMEIMVINLSGKQMVLQW